jgi:hypothetical protein
VLVELMAADSAVVRRVLDENLIAAFEHPSWRRAAESVAVAAEADRSAVLSGLPRELRDRVARRLLGEVEDENREREVNDCIAWIRKRQLGRTRSRLREEIRVAQARGDTAAEQDATRRLSALIEADNTEKVRT